MCWQMQESNSIFRLIAAGTNCAQDLDTTGRLLKCSYWSVWSNVCIRSRFHLRRARNLFDYTGYGRMFFDFWKYGLICQQAPHEETRMCGCRTFSEITETNFTRLLFQCCCCVFALLLVGSRVVALRLLFWTHFLGQENRRK